ncbi:hypothetical protein [Priestia taiwanensis]|uniref:Uncharacterized protein n=1 Tax=Priestia taiwanensis TaxID=1347902 RepID=A0A917AU94_9BACI|nr:hypothetical protein [Priestia taiwanensis]MBM7363581.1 hypothetical protein [Priestia taiwanensis]GGE75908.1 hypothetical protein GCM10007140_27080 [Priestia taiwanensis]
MSQFGYVNMVSAIYAVFFVLGGGLLVRGSQLSEETGLTLDQLTYFTLIILFISFIGILIGYIANKSLKNSYTSYVPVILWFPYFLSFALSAGTLFPSTHPHDDDNYAIGFILLFASILSPFFLAMCISIGILKRDKEQKWI